MKKILILIILLFCVTISGCFPSDKIADIPQEKSGFFWGIWHGWIAPISLIMGFFNNDIRVYDFNNTGWWYDFGFYIAIISGFGSISFARSQKKVKKKD